MNFEDIYVVNDRLEKASAADVIRAEGELGCRFPTGYSDYVERFGAGSLDDLVRVYLPQKIIGELADWRETKSEFWFWDDPDSAVDKSRVLASAPLADTLNGDEFCFHPDDPDVVIVLPRDVDRSYAVGSGLRGALDWVFTSGVLQDPGGPLAFESHLGRKYVRHESDRGGDLEAIRRALLTLEAHALVDDARDYHSVVYYPSIGGRVSLMRLDTGEVDALIVHDEEAPRESLRAIQNALEQAGAPFRTQWG